jgi:hypothetical protein
MSLPPGVTQDMIDRHLEYDGPVHCGTCGALVDRNDIDQESGACSSCCEQDAADAARAYAESACAACGVIHAEACPEPLDADDYCPPRGRP